MEYKQLYSSCLEYLYEEYTASSLAESGIKVCPKTEKDGEHSCNHRGGGSKKHGPEVSKDEGF